MTAKTPGAHTTGAHTTVSTHILDTALGRPAADVAVELSVRPASDAPWAAHADSGTDADGRCKDLPALPEGTAYARLRFEVEPYLARAGHPSAKGRGRGAFFPEVAVVFAVESGEHYHVPLLLSPFGYSVYRGS